MYNINNWFRHNVLSCFYTIGFCLLVFHLGVIDICLLVRLTCNFPFSCSPCQALMLMDHWSHRMSWGDCFYGFALFLFNNTQSSQVWTSPLVSIMAVKLVWQESNFKVPEISQLGHYHMDILKQVYKKYLYRVFFIVIARNWKQKSLNRGLIF